MWCRGLQTAGLGPKHSHSDHSLVARLLDIAVNPCTLSRLRYNVSHIELVCLTPTSAAAAAASLPMYLHSQRRVHLECVCVGWVWRADAPVDRAIYPAMESVAPAMGWPVAVLRAFNHSVIWPANVCGGGRKFLLEHNEYPRPKWSPQSWFQALDPNPYQVGGCGKWPLPESSHGPGHNAAQSCTQGNELKHNDWVGNIRLRVNTWPTRTSRRIPGR